MEDQDYINSFKEWDRTEELAWKIFGEGFYGLTPVQQDKILEIIRS